MSGRLMGLDPGERRVGVALSDELGLLASPLCILERRSWAADVAALVELVRTHDVAEVVVGHPKTLRGEVGPQARRAAPGTGRGSLRHLRGQVMASEHPALGAGFH